MGKNIIWQAQPRQAAFLKRSEYEVLYGGAAGGGKSDASVMFPLYWVHIPHFRALILRKTFPQLSELIDKSRNYYPQAFPAARYNATAHRWTFPSGAIIDFGSMHTPADRENYRGKQYDVIIFDELTHFTWEEYSFMFSRNRPSGPGTFVCIRATTNPGGIGHGWVKDRFITAAPPLTPIVETVTVPDGAGKTETMKRTRIFVPATVHDNPALLNNDPAYLANLAMLPPAERDAQLYGSWDSFSGQVFREWRNDPAHYEDHLYTHVIAPCDIPKHWPVVRGMDWGFSRPFSVGWWAFDESGRAWGICEYYGVTERPNEGVKMHAREVAAEIKRFEKEHPLLRDRIITGVADPAIFSNDGSICIADDFASEGIYFDRGANNRIDGKMQLHYRLAFDETGTPMMYVFNTCKNLIRTLPSLVYSQKHVEDVDTDQEDHAYDQTRYVMMTRQIRARKITQLPPTLISDSDPLNQKPAKFFRI
jgi:hypothetical protein